MYNVIYSENAVKDLRKIDKSVAQRIIKKIENFSKKENLKPFSRALKGFEGKYRFRIGDYRAIFTIDKSGEIHILMILNIKHRKNIYKS